MLRRALGRLAAGRRPLRAKLISTYYETEDRALLRKGLSLRVRECDGQFVQTIKALGDNKGGPLSRGEWKDVISAADPDLHATAAGRMIEPEIFKRLKPAFRTEVRRDLVELRPAPGTRIEAAIDHGVIIAPNQKRSLQISEIELELKSSEASSLYDVAQQLMTTAAVRIDPRSKAERGYAFASGQGRNGAPARAKPLELAPKLSAAEAFERIGHYCLDQIIRNEAMALAGDPDGIHQMRVGIRRLRAAISAFRRLLPQDQRRWASKELRWLADTLGDARNLDVLKTAVIGRARRAIQDKRDFRLLTEAVRAKRHVAYFAIKRAIESSRYGTLVLQLARWFDCPNSTGAPRSSELEMPIFEIAPTMLDRYRRSVERLSKNFAGQSPGERHALRIAPKKMRYTAELFAGLYPGASANEFTQRLKRLQNGLGAANDVYIAETLIGEVTMDAEGNAGIGSSGRRVVE